MCINVLWRCFLLRKNEEQLIWNTFFISLFISFSRSAPIKMIFFHVCYNQRVEKNVLLLQIESRMCSCYLYSLFYSALNRIELHWLNLVRTLFVPRSCRSRCTTLESCSLWRAEHGWRTWLIEIPFKNVYALISQLKVRGNRWIFVQK